MGGVGLRRFLHVMGRQSVMTLRVVRVLGCLLVITLPVMLSGQLVVLGRFLVVLGRLRVMLRCRM